MLRSGVLRPASIKTLVFEFLSDVGRLLPIRRMNDALIVGCGGEELTSPNLNAKLTLGQKRSKLTPESLRVHTAHCGLPHRHLLQLVFDKFES